MLIASIKLLIEEFPTYGCQRITALLHKREQFIVNPKKVYWLMREHRWMLTQRKVSLDLRVQIPRSRTERSDEPWVMDISYVHCRADGWSLLVAVIDCHDREIVSLLCKTIPCPGKKRKRA